MDVQAWAQHLRGLVTPVLAGTPLDGDAPGDPGRISDFIASFSDEFGHRRAVDPWLLGRLLRHPVLEMARAGVRHTQGQPDLAMWETLTEGPAETAASRALSLASLGGGPIIGEEAFQSGAIEATTEAELSALHALGHLMHADEAVRGRALDAAQWHVETLQPDNGTNHPWAIHVFVMLAESDAAFAPGAMLHAETLVHNALVRSGRPDRFSACVMLDAAEALERI